MSLTDVVITLLTFVFVHRDDTTSEYKEPAYDCPLELEENPAYEAVQK